MSNNTEYYKDLHKDLYDLLQLAEDPDHREYMRSYNHMSTYEFELWDAKRAIEVANLTKIISHLSNLF